MKIYGFSHRMLNITIAQPSIEAQNSPQKPGESALFESPTASPEETCEYHTANSYCRTAPNNPIKLKVRQPSYAQSPAKFFSQSDLSVEGVLLLIHWG